MKAPGSPAVGATVNGNAALVMRATRVGAETTLAHILAIVERAQTEKAPVQRLADRVSAIFVPSILLIAVITFAAWVLTGHALVASMVPAVAVLVSPAPVRWGWPRPWPSWLPPGVAPNWGILIRGGESLERIQALRTVVFDKTGTLTQGAPQVVDVVAIGHADSSATPSLRWQVGRAGSRASTRTSRSSRALARRARWPGRCGRWRSREGVSAAASTGPWSPSDRSRGCVSRESCRTTLTSRRRDGRAGATVMPSASTARSPQLLALADPSRTDARAGSRTASRGRGPHVVHVAVTRGDTSR